MLYEEEKLKMFRCQECKEVSKPFDKPLKIVTATRKKEYFTKEGKPVRTRKGTQATGWEIVEEIDVCKKCFEEKTTQS